MFVHVLAYNANAVEAEIVVGGLNATTFEVPSDISLAFGVCPFSLFDDLDYFDLDTCFLDIFAGRSGAVYTSAWKLALGNRCCSSKGGLAVLGHLFHVFGSFCYHHAEFCTLAFVSDVGQISSL